MTRQAMNRLLADDRDHPAADRAIDQHVSAAKEASSIRAEVQARNFIERLNGLMAGSPAGYVTVTWKDGIVGCALANGVQQGVAAGKPLISAAIDWAILDLRGEVGF